MINVTKKFRAALFNDHQHFIESLTIVLSDNTTLNLTNDDLMDGIEFEDMVSEDDNFQIGAAIVNRCTISINNLYDDYTDYNFDNAIVRASVGLDFGDNTSEVIRKFTGFVDEAKYNGTTIDLSCLDNMGLFDYEYDGGLSFPATLGTIVQYCCSDCNVTLATQTFPRYDLSIAAEPDFGGNCTYRQIIAWVAQMCCCYARCDNMGRLQLDWYDMSSLDAQANRLDGGQFDNGTPIYQTGMHADGGGFMTDGDEYDGGDFTTATGVHNIVGIFSCEVCKDPVEITGISVTSAPYEINTVDENNNPTTASTTYTAMTGTDGYVLSISDNPLIASQAEATATANYIAAALVGFTFWTGTVTHLGNPSIEAGDVMLFYDHKGVTYRGVVSSTRFKCGDQQQTKSSAQTPTQNAKQQRTSADVVSETIQQLENWLRRQKTAYEVAIDDLSNALDAKSGLYTTKETTQSGDIWYLHDKPLLADSTKVIKITSDAIGFSTDGGTTWNAGITIDGNMVARIMSAIGVNAAWGIYGVIRDHDNKNVWDLDNSTFSMADGSINLGKIGNTNNYNFSVTSAGAMTMKSGSITLGDKVNTNYYFAVDTDGKFEWKSLYTQLTNDGQLTMTKGSINLGNGKFILNDQGEMTSVDGYYKTILNNGFLRWWYNNSYIGKMGASIFTISGTDYYGAMHDIGYNARFGGFAVQYNSTAANATMKFYYDRTDDVFHSDLELRANYGLKTYLLKGNPGLRVEANQFGVEYNSTTYLLLANGNLSVPQGAVHAGTSVYANGEKVVTPSDLNIYADGTIKWKAYDT